MSTFLQRDDRQAAIAKYFEKYFDKYTPSGTTSSLVGLRGPAAMG